MITFEIDGEEFTAEISATEIPNAIAFNTSSGVTYWMQAPVAV